MKRQHWQDWVNLILGAWIFVSPWVFGQSGSAGSWNVWILGAIIAVVAAIAIGAYRPWLEWINLAAGAWLLISPWIWNFYASSAQLWDSVIVGIVVGVLALWSLAAANSEGFGHHTGHAAPMR